MIEIRAARLPADARAIAAIDTSYSTQRAYEAVFAQDGMRLETIALDNPVIKRVALENLEAEGRDWDEAFVVVVDGKIRGFAATAFHPHNHRLVLRHFYVNRTDRSRGIGRELIRAIDTHAAMLGAHNIWLETTSLNVPGIAAYRALGFTLSGADATLYNGSPDEGTAALFFTRPVTKTEI